MDKITSIFVKRLYNGGYELRATLESGQEVIIKESKHVLEVMVDALNEHGFDLELEPGQKIRRLEVH